MSLQLQRAYKNPHAPFAWGCAATVFQQSLIGTVVIAVLSFVGVLVDPTTNGVGDSAQALNYEKPKD